MFAFRMTQKPTGTKIGDRTSTSANSQHGNTPCAMLAIHALMRRHILELSKPYTALVSTCVCCSYFSPSPLSCNQALSLFVRRRSGERECAARWIRLRLCNGRLGLGVYGV